MSLLTDYIYNNYPFDWDYTEKRIIEIYDYGGSESFIIMLVEPFNNIYELATGDLTLDVVSEIHSRICERIDTIVKIHNLKSVYVKTYWNSNFYITIEIHVKPCFLRRRNSISRECRIIKNIGI